MGYLKRIGPKRYRYAYEGPRMDGKRQQLTGTFYELTKTEAEAELAKLEAQARSGEHVKNPNLTFKQLFSDFMEKKKPVLAVSTHERYEMFGRIYILPTLGDMKVRDLRQAHLVDAYGKWRVHGSQNKPVSGRTVHHVHDLIRCVLNFGIRRDLVSRNVAALIPPEALPKAPKPEPRALDAAEIKLLLDTAKMPSTRSVKRSYLSAEPWFAPAVAFSIYTGARRGEVVAVKWSDLNLDAKSVTIRRSLAETKTAGRFFKRPRMAKLERSRCQNRLFRSWKITEIDNKRSAKLLATVTRMMILYSRDRTARSYSRGTTLRRSATWRDALRLSRSACTIYEIRTLVSWRRTACLLRSLASDWDTLASASRPSDTCTSIRTGMRLPRASLTVCAVEVDFSGR